MFTFPFVSVLGGIRTPDRRLRRPLLYPAELPGLNFKTRLIIIKFELESQQPFLMLLQHFYTLRRSLAKIR